ncbi:MAG: transposase [Roseovarius sp.]|uniref:hypothetical protein n=1 Tax=Roseovarius sp. TaxID=1486281 RepID=UPI002619267A|nr:hypothetical protein [Roseovarius sp.]
MKKHRNHDAGFKARVALEAEKGERTVSEQAAEYGVHPTMIDQWKRVLLQGAYCVFERGAARSSQVMKIWWRNSKPESRSWRWPTLSWN